MITERRQMTLRTDLSTAQAHLLDDFAQPAWVFGDLAFHVGVERDRLAAAFAFCEDNPDARIQVTIRNLGLLQKALEAVAAGAREVLP